MTLDSCCKLFQRNHVMSIYFHEKLYIYIYCRNSLCNHNGHKKYVKKKKKDIIIFGMNQIEELCFFDIAKLLLYTMNLFQRTISLHVNSIMKKENSLHVNIENYWLLK